MVRPVFHLAIVLGIPFCIGSSTWGMQAPDAMQPLAERFAAMKKEYEARDKQFYEELVAAKRDNQKVGQANDEFNKFCRALADKLKVTIREYRDDPAVFDGILVLAGTIRTPLDDDLVRLVLEKHATHPRMGQLCFDLTQRSGEAWAERIIKTAAENHPLPEVRGQAKYALAEYNRWRGLPLASNTQPTPEDAKRWLALSEVQYSEVAKEHADVRTPDGKARLGDKAKAELARLRNLAQIAIGKPAPEIEGHDVDGQAMKLSDYRGKVVVLDFWGHW